MSGAGAALRGQRRALREGLSELRARRDELSGQIRAQEAERGRLQARMAALARRLADTSESLAGLRAARAQIDRTIAETEAACGQVLDNSQTLLDILKEESGNDGKAREPQSSSLGQQAHQQKRS
ncbi:microtubule nucleation factor SSNA1-like [Myiozetetes cayanensis]|uniref:microtubule nucleation factor SSNA1-like n=1 Tax=Myiozetetes cayanensis TaxID=478635 RepID=UPI00215E6B67|nr:microtubule nucleation factor SSNA1-like [Myiozetetes cayanensis]